MNKKTMSITVWEGQYEIIKAAAAAADPPVSISEYMRQKTLPAAAKELGIDLPDFPPFELPRFRRGAIAQVAEMLGVTSEQFKQESARKTALAMLDEMTAPRTSTVPPPAEEKPPSQSGTHTIKPTPITTQYRFVRGR